MRDHELENGPIIYKLKEKLLRKKITVSEIYRIISKGQNVYNQNYKRKRRRNRKNI